MTGRSEFAKLAIVLALGIQEQKSTPVGFRLALLPPKARARGVFCFSTDGGRAAMLDGKPSVKQAVAEHPKTYRLMGLLRINRREAIGVLELLWKFTGSYSPQGDVGRHDDFIIAKACDVDVSVEGSVETFIDSLVKSGWIDRDETHRLVVHDWLDECPSWIHAALAKGNRNRSGSKRLRIRRQAPQPSESTDHSTEASTEASVKGREGNRRLRSAASKNGAPVEFPTALNCPEFLAAWADWEQHRREIKKPLTPKSVSMQLRKFERWGVRRSIEAIEFTIEKSWQGIQEPTGDARPAKEFKQPVIFDLEEP